MNRLNKAIGALLAFGVGIILLPLLPFVMAVVVYNEVDDWEGR